MNRYYFYLTACLILCFLDGCRQELPTIRSEVEYVTLPSDPQSIEGFFLVNEGNMGSNKCTIDHFDARTGSYFRNIYPERKPQCSEGTWRCGQRHRHLRQSAVCGSKLFQLCGGDECAHGRAYRQCEYSQLPLHCFQRRQGVCQFVRRSGTD